MVSVFKKQSSVYTEDAFYTFFYFTLFRYNLISDLSVFIAMCMKIHNYTSHYIY